MSTEEDFKRKVYWKDKCIFGFSIDTMYILCGCGSESALPIWYARQWQKLEEPALSMPASICEKISLGCSIFKILPGVTLKALTGRRTLSYLSPKQHHFQYGIRR